MKTQFRLKKVVRYFLYTLLAVVIFSSCTSNKTGEIVMDKNGYYYELTHDNAFMGAEMYRLELIDTTKYKVVGFNKR